jgi:cytochrome c oxidase subunit 2
MSNFNDWFAEKILVLPVRAATGAKPIDDLIVYVHYLMLALFVGWILYFFYALWRFNVRRNTRADHVGSTSALPKYVEIIVVVAEVILLLVFAVPMWAKNVRDFPDPKQSTVLSIVAEQFAWNIRYPDTDGNFKRSEMKLVSATNVFGVDFSDPSAKEGFILKNEFHVPVDKPVIIYLTSKDVIHSLKLVAMRTTQDAIPGLRIPFSFTPDRVGRYQIECAQLCGGGHAYMSGGFVNVDSKEDYEKWFKSKSGS